MPLSDLQTIAMATAAAALVLTLWHRPKGAKRGSPTPGLPVASQGAIAAHNTAVITGGGSGIGRAVALALAREHMNIVLADVNEEDMTAVSKELVAAGAWPSHILCVKCDVSKLEDVQALKEKVWFLFGGCHFLFNNAAIQHNGKAGAIEHLDRWKDTLAVNLMGVLHGAQVFTQAMIDEAVPCVIVNVGSKQGITAPPGDTAYNVSKAGVKVLTEGLQHTLRNIQGCKVNAFLLVPGWTISMMGTHANQRLQGSAWDESTAEDERMYRGNKDPEFAQKSLVKRGAWTAKQVADDLIKAVKKGAPFYIICEDNETTTAMDNGRIQWACDDLLFRRVPLSRWSKQYEAEYKTVSKDFN